MWYNPGQAKKRPSPVLLGGDGEGPTQQTAFTLAACPLSVSISRDIAKVNMTKLYFNGAVIPSTARVMGLFFVNTTKGQAFFHGKTDYNGQAIPAN